ncbi:MAG: hypothetical protein QOD00_2229, partial [Blastocatellia bacterium]|nr:hypothetical protein [Blastocatellia bacterium]
LLATQVMTRVRGVLGVEMGLRKLFEKAELGEFAREIERAQEGVVQEGGPHIGAMSRGEVLPLSFAQQRLWFIDQLEPGNPIYNTPLGVRLRGVLNLDALEQALTELVRRHESLRTVFRLAGEEPEQSICEPVSFEMPVEDLSCLPETAREEEARRLAIEETKVPFDLSRGPLVRARLLQLGAEEHILLFTMHHIISDGWSMGVLVREVAALYEAFSKGQASPLPELPVQYGDYAMWQREYLQGRVLFDQLAYWRERLAGAPPLLELPTDRPRPKAQTYRGASLPLKLSKELTDHLRALSRRESVTLFMTLLAAFQTLLSRYSGESDISVGTPVANRTRAEIESLIGFFVNTLVMRTEVSRELSFRELVKRVREVCLGAYAHQDVPFEKLVEELQPERSLSHSPLFQVMFVLQNAPQEKLELSGLTLDLLDIESGTAKFDLMLSLEESEDGLEGVCEYSADLFDEATVRRMLEHFRTLLAGIVANPDERISSLPLLTSNEEQQLLYQWNETAKQFPQNLCVHELFARQSERTPDSIALIFEDERLNYAELNERANKLAHHLRALGVGAEQVVGLMMERSVEMLVSVLAVLKAGGAYLPLDSEYPQERLAFMLEDARARVLLTQSKLVQQLPEVSARVLLLDEDWETIELESGQDFESGATPDNPAYVIYTSGSTGRPKAVVMPHRAASNLINFQIESSGREGQGRTLQFASLSFDVSFQEIFPTLCAGGALVLLREDERKDARELLRVIMEQRVERLFLPFVALQHLAEVAETEKLSPKSLRQVITAGEQLKITPHVARLFKSLEGCVLDNHYGPTETHLATILRLEGDADLWPKLPPIGRPIANARVYVLDDALQPVPAGVTGELYIGGEQLARGYLNRPGQTAERFIPHPYPFTDESAARLYKTGDLARYSADGVLEYAGRCDRQVKVRGFRVEVGEVEARLKEHSGLKQATIVAWDDDAGRKRLVAYVVAAQSASAPSIADLRLFLTDRLPDYMIPASFIFLPA